MLLLPFGQVKGRPLAMMEGHIMFSCSVPHPARFGIAQTYPHVCGGLLTVTAGGVLEKGEETVIVSGGNLFQIEGCPYALQESQAAAVYRDDGIPGNTILLAKHGNGTGQASGLDTGFDFKP